MEMKRDGVIHPRARRDPHDDGPGHRVLPALLLMALAAACGSQASDPIEPDPVNKYSHPPGPTPEKTPVDPAMARELAVNPDIQVGKLENGLTYFIMPHRQPEKRAMLWLGVNAGSAQEDDDQQGLAHFVEHMAFNGTERFEKMAIVNYLEGIGMKFGPDVNAYTSFDQTVYMLQLPTDDAAIMARGFDILKDWASAVSFEAEEVAKERGVVLEEWRLGRGAGKRILDKQYPVLFKGSRYAGRLPIGKAEILRSAPRDALVRYYKDWYRPDLMAVVAVGDFDPRVIRGEIEKRFAGLENPAKPRPRAVIDVPSHPETLVSIETDPEMPRTSVAIYHKMARRPEGTAGDYRRYIAERLYHSMLNARYDELRRKPDSPFLFAFSGTSAISRSADGFIQRAAVKQGKIDACIDALITEVTRVERHGFTKGELERARKQLLRSYQQYAAEKDKANSREYASEILRHYFTDEAMPGRDAELALVEEFLPTFTLEELNQLTRSWVSKKNGVVRDRVVLVSGPDKAPMPTRSAILATIDAADGKDIAPYEDNSESRPLLAADKKPRPGAIVERKTIAELGVTWWQLSNGVEVVLKPTDFKNDEVLLTGFSPGGHSLVKDADYQSARYATSLATESGVGEFSAVDLRKTLAGKVVRLSPYIRELEEGVRGSASPDDLETLFQLVHLRFTAPRKDAEAFQAWSARTREFIANRRLRPESVFFEDMTAFMAKNHLRRRPSTTETLAEVDPDKALEIYRERFGDADDFTFVLVGNFDLAAVEGLATTYLASLPGEKGAEKWRDVGVRRPKGVRRFTVEKGAEPKSSVQLTFHGARKWSPDNANDLRMLIEVLRIRLREVMREDMGGVYGVRVSGGISRRPIQESTVRVSFSCAPDNVDSLVQAVFTEAAAIQKRGIAAEYIDKIKKIRVRTHETDLRRNGFWLRQLATAYRYQRDPREILDHQKMVDKVSSKRVRSAARSYLRKKQYVLGVLQPE